MKRVVLVRTQGPRNAGLALRACANFGPAELVLVAPARPALLLHPELVRMAHGVENVRERVLVMPSLDEALADCTASVAFTARPRGRARVDWQACRPEVLEWARDPRGKLALVFGAEENGLSTAEVERCRLVCSIGTSKEHTSINLALAVGIVLAELYEGRSLRRREGTVHMVRGEDLEYLKAHLKRVLGGQVARGPAARRDIEESIERIFTRAPVESRDSRAWHKVLRALGGELPPSELGLSPPARDRRRAQALGRSRGGEPSREGAETGQQEDPRPPAD